MANNFAWGWCTWGAAQLAPWIQSSVTGNASQWVDQARAGGNPISQVPVVGSVAVWNSSLPGSSGDGHVAVVQSVNAANHTFTVQEMNYTAFGQYDTRVISSMDYITGFILPKGAQVPTGAWTTQAGSSTASAGNAHPGTSTSTTGLDLNPLDAVGNVWKAFTSGLTRIVLVIFAVILVIAALAYLFFSTDTGKQAAKLGAEAAVA